MGVNTTLRMEFTTATTLPTAHDPLWFLEWIRRLATRARTECKMERTCVAKTPNYMWAMPWDGSLVNGTVS